MKFPTQQLLNWFSMHQRKLPWRKNYSPYDVWLSEVMAQQTRIEQMLPYYEKFLKQFPHVKSLADADEERVLKAWEGLGYYSRARNLHHTAKQIAYEKKGKFPQTKKEWQELKGVGPYISSAIASIAFNENVPVVDGNVLRVMSRVWGNPSDIAENETKKIFEEKMQTIVPDGHAREFNQALMELGALVCVPENPLCEKCPLTESCFAFLHEKQSDFPMKTKKAKTPHKHFAAIRLWSGKKMGFIKRHQKLLQGMYDYPMVEYAPLVDSPAQLEKKFSAALEQPITLGKNKGSVKHAYTHFTQHVHLFEGKSNMFPQSLYFFDTHALKRIPLSNVQQKLMKLGSLAK